MKRIVAILLMLTLCVGLMSGCKTKDSSLGQVAGVGGVPGGQTAPTPDGGEQTTPDANEGAQNTPAPNGGEQTTPTPNEGNQTTPTPENPSQNEGGNNQSEQNPAETVDYTTEDWIKVCSYNVKVLYYNHSNDGNGQPMSKFQAVCDELRKIDADIVGLQELDRFSKRSGAEVDQLMQLAKALGYKYYHYTNTVPSGGGEYGHGVLSRYKLNNSKIYSFQDYAGDINPGERRCFSRHELKINGKTLVFYNTHLADARDRQIGIITGMMEKDMKAGKYALVTGDMNYLPHELAQGVDADYCTMLNTVDGAKNTTYQGWINPTQHSYNKIDNIVVTNNLEYYWNSKEQSGIVVTNTSASDHLPIYTYVRFK
jgi:endonuclease/exonuclease/phosphatase family metal-dependent hydrolase